MKPEESIDYHIKIAWQAIVNKYNQIAAGYDMTQAVGYVLISVDLDRGTSVSAVAAILGVRPTSLSRILNTMEEQGWIIRKVDESDKRQVNIYLTGLGKEKQKVAKSVVRKFNAYLDEHISSEEKEKLILTIQKISKLANSYKT